MVSCKFSLLPLFGLFSVHRMSTHSYHYRCLFLEPDALYFLHGSFLTSSSLLFSLPLSLSYDFHTTYCLHYYLPSCFCSFSFIYQKLYSFARAATTKYRRLCGLNRNLFSHNFGRQKSKMKMSSRLIYFEVFFLACKWPYSLCVFTGSFLCGCLCCNYLLFYGDQAYLIRILRIRKLFPFLLISSGQQNY